MATDAADLRVWLDTQGDAGKLRIVPYVRAAAAMDLRYELLLTKQGAGGSSRITQRGEVRTVADEPRALSQLSVGVLHQLDRCVVEITLSQGAEALGTYAFDCPAPEPR